MSAKSTLNSMVRSASHSHVTSRFFFLRSLKRRSGSPGLGSNSLLKYGTNVLCMLTRVLFLNSAINFSLVSAGAAFADDEDDDDEEDEARFAEVAETAASGSDDEEEEEVEAVATAAVLDDDDEEEDVEAVATAAVLDDDDEEADDGDASGIVGTGAATAAP